NNEVEYPTEATVGDQWLRSFEIHSEELLAQSLSSADLHPRISKVAYDLYLNRGGVHGHDLDDWLVAERIVLFQLSQKKRKAAEEPFETNSRIPQFEQIEGQTAFNGH
ncbi:MAG TPA: DUF2934 domain-containing protein, partial [Candidatus Binatia bacterium]